MSLSPRPRPGILDVAPYVPGASALPGRARVMKLSSNEGPFGPPPAAQRALAAAAPHLHRYPDGGCRRLRQAIGAYFSLDPERIVCGAGSDELIAMLCNAYGGSGVDLIMNRHGFMLYSIYGRLAGCRVIKTPERDLTVDPEAILEAVTPATGLVCLVNPNNPTGTILTASAMRRLRDALPPHILLVIDSAYAEYVDHPDYDAGVGLVDSGESTVMLRSFSKIFGLGGARVGWAYAPSAILDILHRVRSPFNISSASQEAAIAALEEPDWVERCQIHNTRQRSLLFATLQQAGLRVIPGQANFLLVDFGTEARAAQADAHLRAEGILVRTLGGYELPQMLRITVGTEEERMAVGQALCAFAGLPAA